MTSTSPSSQTWVTTPPQTLIPQSLPPFNATLPGSPSPPSSPLTTIYTPPSSCPPLGAELWRFMDATDFEVHGAYMPNRPACTPVPGMAASPAFCPANFYPAMVTSKWTSWSELGSVMTQTVVKCCPSGFIYSGSPIVHATSLSLYDCVSPIPNPTAIEHIYIRDDQIMTATLTNLSSMIVTYSQYSTYQTERITSVSFLTSSVLSLGDTRTVIAYPFEAIYESTDVEVAAGWRSIFSARSAEVAESSSKYEEWRARRTEGLVPLPVEFQYLLAGSSSASADATSNGTSVVSNLPIATDSPSSSRISAGAIAGIVIGAVLGLALLVTGIFLLLKRRRGRGIVEEADKASMTRFEKAELDDTMVPPKQMGTETEIREIEASGARRAELAGVQAVELPGAVVELPAGEGGRARNEGP